MTWPRDHRLDPPRRAAILAAHTASAASQVKRPANTDIWRWSRVQSILSHAAGNAKPVLGAGISASSGCKKLRARGTSSPSAPAPGLVHGAGGPAGSLRVPAAEWITDLDTDHENLRPRSILRIRPARGGRGGGAGMSLLAILGKPRASDRGARINGGTLERLTRRPRAPAGSWVADSGARPGRRRGGARLLEAALAARARRR